METTALTVRITDELLESIDHLVEYMVASSAHLGMKPTRSDAVRLCITGYLVDHGDTIRALLKAKQAKQGS